jgi:mRNA interferase MazF
VVTDPSLTGPWLTGPRLTGMVVWCEFGEPTGREQGGRRPGVVISSEDFIDAVHQMTVVVPCTGRDRGWVNHIELTGETGLPSQTFAITEQPRALSTQRVHGVIGRVDDDCLRAIMRWVTTWLHPADRPGR